MGFFDFLKGNSFSIVENEINKIGYQKCIKALAIYVIQPYLPLIEDQEVAAQYACEKFLRDQFDGMASAFGGSGSIPSQSLNDFYNEYLKHHKEDYLGALGEDFHDYDDLNDSPAGPSQRQAKLSMCLQNISNRSPYSINVAVDVIREVFRLFKAGFFLPQEQNHELVDYFRQRLLTYQLTHDPIPFGAHLGYLLTSNNKREREIVWTEVRRNYESYMDIVQNLNAKFGFIH